MAYEMRELDGHAVILDSDGNSIADIESRFDEERGCNVLTPVFSPDMALQIVRALNGYELKVRLVVDASGVISALSGDDA